MKTYVRTNVIAFFDLVGGRAVRSLRFGGGHGSTGMGKQCEWRTRQRHDQRRGHNVARNSHRADQRDRDRHRRRLRLHPGAYLRRYGPSLGKQRLRPAWRRHNHEQNVTRNGKRAEQCEGDRRRRRLQLRSAQRRDSAGMGMQ